jgi:hypothetical protein
MTADQKTVAIGSVSGIISMILLMAIIYRFWPASPELTNVAARLGYTVRALTFAALPLLIGKVTVANARFSTDAIDPTRHAENRAMEINGRFVDNTVQQLAVLNRHAGTVPGADAKRIASYSNRRNGVRDSSRRVLGWLSRATHLSGAGNVSDRLFERWSARLWDLADYRRLVTQRRWHSSPRY